jgi:hypothetical protein
MSRRWHRAWHSVLHGLRKSELEGACGSYPVQARQLYVPQMIASSGISRISQLNPLNAVVKTV